MGVQRGAPSSRTFAGETYKLYKEYDAMFGEKEQLKDIQKLKDEKWKVRKVHIHKGLRDIERSTYIRRKQP